MDEDLLFMLFILNYLQSNENISRTNNEYKYRLKIEGIRLRYGYIPILSLVNPLARPFVALIRSANDGSLIKVTGLDFSTFWSLSKLFSPIILGITPYSSDGVLRKKKSKVGRRRNLNPIMLMGMILMWTRTKGSNHILSMIFGSTISPLNLWQRVSLRVMHIVLKKLPTAQVRRPTSSKFESYVDAIRMKYSVLGEMRVAMSLDGLKLMIQSTTCPVRQNAFYNGWTCGHYISNIFVFAPDGKIVAMVINAPGSFHESNIMHMGGLYDRLELWPTNITSGLLSTQRSGRRRASS